MGSYYNPTLELRMQRATAYKKNVYAPACADAKKGIRKEPTQEECLLQYLKWYASITPLEALSAFGCFRLSARIADLRSKGYPITTEISEGEKKFAIYRLKKKKKMD